MPHAPLLLPELESEEVAASAARIRDAAGALALEDVEALVVVSPHAPGTGSYSEVAGDLSSFGVPGVEVTAEAVALPGIGSLSDPIDHGISVPLRMLGWGGPVGAVGFAEEGLDLGDVVTVERAIESVTERVAVIVSVNLAAGLSPRAPLIELEGAAEAEEMLLQAIQQDLGWLLTGAKSIADAGSCGMAPLMLMARLFKGRRARVLAHEAPVGVGYLVAEVV